MSEQLKVILAVLLGSALLWFGVSTLLTETEDFSNNLTVSSTSYLEREDSLETTAQIAAAKAAQEASDDLKKQLKIEALDVTEQAVEDDTTQTPNADPEKKSDDPEQASTGNDTEQSFVPENEDTQQTKTENVADTETRDEKNDLSSQDTKLAEKEEGTVRGIELALVFDTGNSCQKEDEEPFYVGVLFRSTSASIKGVSFSDINQLVELFKTCGGGTLVVMANEKNSAIVSESLVERRKEEVKYYLLQRRIPKENILVSKNS